MTTIMTGEEFTAWRGRHGLTRGAAAMILGMGKNQPGFYESGKHRIPKHVKLACLAIDEGLNSPRHIYEDFGAAVDFAVDSEAGGLDFLRLWREGCWEEINRDWPEWKAFIEERNSSAR